MPPKRNLRRGRNAGEISEIRQQLASIENQTNQVSEEITLASIYKLLQDIAHAQSILMSKVDALALEINKPKRIRAARGDEPLYSINTSNYERLKEDVEIDSNLKNFLNQHYDFDSINDVINSPGIFGRSVGTLLFNKEQFIAYKFTNKPVRNSPRKPYPPHYMEAFTAALNYVGLVCLTDDETKTSYMEDLYGDLNLYSSNVKLGKSKYPTNEYYFGDEPVIN
uniref:Reverse transcriptase domain-containing protein n=1 Tax=Strongyloides papillosus TaxID=174720 RepID=A0A0N5C5H7_STREA